MATVLLVEPNVAFRRMMEQELRKAGHEVFGAGETITASRAIRERALDVMVMEMVIPGDVTTADLFTSLRDDPPPGNPARVAMTADANFAAQEAFFRAEYRLDGFLLKPFSPSGLRKAIDDAVAARERRRASPSLPEWSAPQEVGAVPPGELVLDMSDMIPLDTNPHLQNAPAPSPAEFEDASKMQEILLEELVPAPPIEERRAVKRFPVRIPLAVHDGKSPFKSRSENLGRSGVFVVSDRVYYPGTKMRVRLELPVPGQGYAEITVRVTHGSPAAQMTGFGLAFEDMSAETAARLAKFLEDLEAPAQNRPFLVVASHTLGAEVDRVVQSWQGEEVRVRLIHPHENVQEIAESDPPDLMLLDLADPVMVAFVGALKATRATSTIPAVLVDRTAESKSALLAAAAGADRFFSMPADLQAMVDFAVEKLQASRRRSVRVRFNREVGMWVAGAQLAATALDLSETGVQVRVGRDIPEQTVVELSLGLSDGAPPVKLAATVAWKALATDGGELGVRLGLAFEADETNRARIREEVRRALAAGYYVRWLAAAPKPAKPAKPAAAAAQGR